MKKQVVRLVRNSLQLREVVGKVISQRESNDNYSALRIPVRPVVEALVGKWGCRRTIEQIRGTLPGVGQACGECELVGCSVSWLLGIKYFLLICATFLLSLPSVGIPSPMEFSPISKVTHY
jgi:hypothetical protein